jgi:hypothetical protein
VNYKKVDCIMWEKVWSCHQRKKKWMTTTRDPDLTVYPNLIAELTLTDLT